VNSATPYSIIHTPVDTTTCDREPVHIPGCIQSHGLLLVLDPLTLKIVQSSANTMEWIGWETSALIGRGIDVVFGEQQVTRLKGFLTAENLEQNSLYLFTVTGISARGPLDVLVHTREGILFLEFEAAGRTAPGVTPDYYDLLKKVLARLQKTLGLRDFCQAAAKEIKELTTLDRVMIYRFAPDASGWVFAEAKRDDLLPFYDLHYPASDIPKQVREIYLKMWHRLVPDVRAPMVELLPLLNPLTGQPPNLTHCFLRGVSVMYTEYLANMGVTASLTLPLIRDGNLWGLIACHHSTQKFLPYGMRTACEFLAQAISLQLTAAEDREFYEYRLQADNEHQQLIQILAARPDQKLAHQVRELSRFVMADGLALFTSGAWSLVGQTPEIADLENLRTWLESKRERTVFVTEALPMEYSPAQAFAAKASGLLALFLNRQGGDCILWFRTETIQTVHWAGDPRKPVETGPNGDRLTPRKSFELWKESVRLHSLPWREVEIEVVRRLHLSLHDILVTRVEQLSLLNEELKRSNEELDSFAYIASHDLKEPLRSMQSYAHFLREQLMGKIDKASQVKLQSLLRMIRRMDSLIDSLLHFSRVGICRTHEILVLNEVLAEALEMVGPRLKESNVEVRIPRPLPSVLGDRVGLREIFVNLLSNAIKYNDKPARWIEIGFLGAGEQDLLHKVAAVEESQVFFVRDNGIGLQERFYEVIFDIFKRLHGHDEFGGGAGAGLAITRKILERHGGKIWVQSILNEGSTFYFTLPPSGRPSALSSATPQPFLSVACD